MDFNNIIENVLSGLIEASLIGLFLIIFNFLLKKLGLSYVQLTSKKNLGEIYEPVVSDIKKTFF